MHRRLGLDVRLTKWSFSTLTQVKLAKHSFLGHGFHYMEWLNVRGRLQCVNVMLVLFAAGDIGCDHYEQFSLYHKSAMCIQRKHSVYKWWPDTPCTAHPTVPTHRAAHSQWAGHKSVLGLLSSALLGPGLVSPSHRVGVAPVEHQTAGMRRMGQHLTNHCTHTEIYAYIYPYVYSTSTHKDTSISQYTLHIYAHTHLSIRRHGNDVY